MKAPSNSHGEEEPNAKPRLMQDPNDDETGSQSDDSNTAASNNRDDDYYMNEAGFVVMTAAYLLQRGYCCGNGCKHCPYDYKAVPEPKRSYLLEKRANLNEDK